MWEFNAGRFAQWEQLSRNKMCYISKYLERMSCNAVYLICTCIQWKWNIVDSLQIPGLLHSDVRTVDGRM